MQMNPKPPRRFGVPPVVKLLVRGYMVMSFIIAMEYFRIIGNVSFIILLVTVISISMVFGIGYLLVKSGPVRHCSHDIPGTALFFVKGILVLYFVSLLAEFGLLPAPITSLIMMAIATVLVLAGFFSYLWEVFERSRPLPKPQPAKRPASAGPRTR